MDPLSALVVARGLERLMIVAAGAAAMWMGWKLFYRLNNQPDQQAEFSYKQLLVKFQRVGPGIFFAFFGSAVLAFSIFQPLRIAPGDIDVEPGAKNRTQSGSVSYLGGATKVDLERWIVSLNTVLDVAGLPTDSEIPDPDRKLLKNSTNATEELRNELLKLVFGETDVLIWFKWRKDYAKKKNSVPESELQTVARVQEFVDRSLFDQK